MIAGGRGGAPQREAAASLLSISIKSKGNCSEKVSLETYTQEETK